jgi:hypothetical protein
MDALVGMGSCGQWHRSRACPRFVLFAVAPFNLLKGVLVSIDRISDL